MTMDLNHAEAEHTITSERMPAPRGRTETSTIEIGLRAAIISVRDDAPQVLVVKSGSGGRAAADALPSGPFSPINHRTLEIGLRDWVREQSNLDLGYVEQLYTFGDRGRHARPADATPHVVSIGYLALTRPLEDEQLGTAQWRSWYDYFPWEDWRNGKPAVLQDVIEPLLVNWAQLPQPMVSPSRPMDRAQRLRIAFGIDGGSWDEEIVLERYEILYEAGLIEEAHRDGRAAAAQGQSGSIGGVGTGATTAFAIQFIGERLAAGEITDVVGIPTSFQASVLAKKHGIPLTTLDEAPRFDIAIDGADEVDPQQNLIKGGGAAHTREKVVDGLAARFVVVVDSSKLVDKLGSTFALPGVLENGLFVGFADEVLIGEVLDGKASVRTM